MKSIDVNDLRALIALIPPVRALREDVEKSIHLELYPGTGDLSVRTFRSLRDQVARITDDPYVAALELDVEETTKDKQKAAQVLIGTGQLLAYLEAQTGTGGLNGERRGNYSVQTAPNIHLDMGDVIGGQMDRVMDVINNALRGIPGASGRRGQMPPEPPMPPRPPRPPREPRERHERHEYLYREDDEDDEA
jgi:hypothetical protein